MQNVTIEEMIGIVNNGAHQYKVTLSVIGDEGTLVAASTDSNNVYTLRIPHLKDVGGDDDIRCYSSLEGFSIVSQNGVVRELWYYQYYWLPTHRKAGELI